MKEMIKNILDRRENNSNLAELFNIVNALMFNTADEVDRYLKDQSGSPQIAFDTRKEEFKTGVKLFYKEEMI